MRRHYDFSAGRQNPYAHRLPKRAITIRVDESTLDYYKDLASQLGVPYQSLINLYLRDCATRKLRPRLDWKPRKKSEK